MGTEGHTPTLTKEPSTILSFMIGEAIDSTSHFILIVGRLMITALGALLPFEDSIASEVDLPHFSLGATFRVFLPSHLSSTGGCS